MKSKSIGSLAAVAIAAFVIHFGHEYVSGNEAAGISGVGKTSVRSDAPRKSPSSDGVDGSESELVCPKWVTTGVPEQLLRRYAYTASYNRKTLNPNWVGWVLTAGHTDGEYERKGHLFVEDTDVPEPRATYKDIRESECGYQRGHICPAGDNKWSYRAQKEAFLMTNICPQNGYLNQRDWKYLEEACRDWAKQYGKVFIVSGPVFKSRKPKTVGEHGVAVPDAFFKVVLRLAKGKSPAHAIGFVYENKSGHHGMDYYVRSVDEVEKLTGLDFFSPLDDATEQRVEKEKNLGDW